MQRTTKSDLKTQKESDLNTQKESDLKPTHRRGTAPAVTLQHAYTPPSLPHWMTL